MCFNKANDTWMTVTLSAKKTKNKQKTKIHTKRTDNY